MQRTSNIQLQPAWHVNVYTNGHATPVGLHTACRRQHEKEQTHEQIG